MRNSEPAVEYVEDINLTYLTRAGATAATEGAVDVVRMELKIRVPDRSPATQTLTTDVALRNRGN